MIPRGGRALNEAAWSNPSRFNQTPNATGLQYGSQYVGAKLHGT